MSLTTDVNEKPDRVRHSKNVSEAVKEYAVEGVFIGSAVVLRNTTGSLIFYHQLCNPISERHPVIMFDLSDPLEHLKPAGDG